MNAWQLAYPFVFRETKAVGDDDLKFDVRRVRRSGVDDEVDVGDHLVGDVDRHGDAERQDGADLRTLVRHESQNTNGNQLGIDELAQ